MSGWSTGYAWLRKSGARMEHVHRRNAHELIGEERIAGQKESFLEAPPQQTLCGNQNALA
jgi:hypothetical protein